MKKVLLHSFQSETVGGTRSVINDIKSSYLNSKYEFIDLVQEETCGFNPLKALLFVIKYSRLISSKHADIIYVCGLLYSGFLMTLAAKLSNVKSIIVSVHGSEWDKTTSSHFRRWLFLKVLEPMTVRMADCVFTVCKNELNNESIIKGNRGNVYGVVYNCIPQIKLEDYPEGVFRSAYGISKEKILVCVVGRVVEEKGHKYIIDAINSFNDENFVFVIVGDGPYLSEYRKKCAELITRNRLLLLGNRKDVLQILRDCDVFLFATLHENHSKSMLEAARMKCAIICTRVGGNPEIVDDSNAILIPPKDSKMIVSALVEMKDKQKREVFSESAYYSVSEKFSIPNTIGKLDSIFEDL